MKKKKLGRTDIEVTELCFGALPMGPLQKNVPMKEMKELVLYALKKGINFIDTAQIYLTHEPVGRALKETDIKPVIATKSPAESYEDMDEAVREALEVLGVDMIDIFHLHAARVEVDVFEKRAGALECLKEYKAKGKIKAVGISTHSVPVVEKAASRSDIDVVFPILNKIGMGILDGSVKEMEQAVDKVLRSGKGIYLMKALAGGNLLDDFEEAVNYARSIKGSASVAVGMVSKEEVDFNVAYFNNKLAGNQLPTMEGYNKKIVVVQALCKACQACFDACPNQAIVMEEEAARIMEEECLTCGYCVRECPEFAIRVI